MVRMCLVMYVGAADPGYGVWWWVEAVCKARDGRQTDDGYIYRGTVMQARVWDEDEETNPQRSRSPPR